MDRNEQLAKIKTAFANSVFQKPDLISHHPFEKYAVLIYEGFLSSLSKKLAEDVIHASFESKLADQAKMLSALFKVKDKAETRELKLKILLMEADKRFSVNCLELGEEERLFSCEVPFSQNESIDDFLVTALQKINDGILTKLQCLAGNRFAPNRHFGEEPVILRPNVPTAPFVNPSPMFGRPIDRDPFGLPNSYPGVGPHIRFDPVYPPDIGLGQQHPDRGRNPYVPEIGPGTGSLIGPNHPYWRQRKPEGPNFPKFYDK